MATHSGILQRDQAPLPASASSPDVSSAQPQPTTVSCFLCKVEAFPSQAGACLYNTGNFPSHPGQEGHNTEILVTLVSEHLSSFPCSQTAPQNPRKRQEHPACAHSRPLVPPHLPVTSRVCPPGGGSPLWESQRFLPLLHDLDTDRQLLTASVSPSLKCEEWYQLRSSRSIC